MAAHLPRYTPGQTGPEIAADIARAAQQGELLTHLAELLWSYSRCEEAVTIGRRALNIAETLDAVRPLGIAGGALVKSVSAVGEVAEAEALPATLLDQAAVLRPRSTRTNDATAMLILEHSQALLLRQQGRLTRLSPSCSGWCNVQKQKTEHFLWVRKLIVERYWRNDNTAYEVR